MDKQEKTKIYYEKNREHNLLYTKAYREANIEKNKAYRVENREQLLQYNRSYREANIGKYRAYYEENKEEIKAYYEKNKEQILQKAKIFREDDTNKIIMKERRRLYYEENKEQLLQQLKIYRDVNKDKLKEKSKIYKEENKEQILERRPRCKSIWCDTQVNKTRNEGYCLNCYIHNFPENPVVRNYKTKERTVVDYILQKYPNFTWYSDKRIIDGCSKRRPDLLADFGEFIIIIEIDENQHTTYDTICENKRLMELSVDVGHRPIVFIRFNPDEYIIDNNKITSCWTIDGFGICVIKKNKINEWNCRLIKLMETIDFWCNPVNKSEKTIEQIHLFYDDN